MDHRIQVVCSELKRCPGSSVRISDLAKSVNLSPSRLRHLFKAEMDESIGQYRKGARLKTAEVLLRTTLLSVKEITHQIGLGSDSHFTHDFKEAFGLSPTRYRARCLESSGSMFLSKGSQSGQRKAKLD